MRQSSSLQKDSQSPSRMLVALQVCGILVHERLLTVYAATAYIFSSVFDEYVYRPESTAEAPTSSNTPTADNSQSTERLHNATFEVPLNILIDCLNIFGSTGSSSHAIGGHKKWRRAEDGSDAGDDDGRSNIGGRLEQYFVGDGKRTGMRMKYMGTGHPLTLFL